MTEKRFGYTMFDGFDDDGKELSQYEVLDLLNSLAEENEICKQAYSEIKEDAIRLRDENEQLRKQREELFIREKDTKNKWRELKRENEQLKQTNQRLRDKNKRLHKDWDKIYQLILEKGYNEEEILKELSE